MPLLQKRCVYRCEKYQRVKGVTGMDECFYFLCGMAVGLVIAIVVCIVCAG